MYKINEIVLDYEPRKQILSKLPAYPNEPEMSEFESAFLCGLLNEFKPQKILEIGVAAGGTTAIILQCLDNQQKIGGGYTKYKMHSVDFSASFYRDNTKPTGFLAEIAKNILNIKNHKFYRGAGVTSFLAEIGSEIDFAILDTMHLLPGEILDFLVILPYLKKNAVVCMHDVTECQRNNRSSFATGALLSAVNADKIINFDLENTKFKYPNIAAFQINERTKEDIINVFLTLLLPWSYLPPNSEINNYTKYIYKTYNQNACKIYDESIRMNLYNLIMATNQYDDTIKNNLYNMIQSNYKLNS